MKQLLELLNAADLTNSSDHYDIEAKFIVENHLSFQDALSYVSKKLGYIPGSFPAFEQELEKLL